MSRYRSLSHYRRLLLIPLLGVALMAAGVIPTGASSHREAPLISEDPVADDTDVYAFVSPDRPDTVTMIGNWIPLEEPAGGPNFYKFGQDVLYQFKIDNNADAVPDVIYEFRFETKVLNSKTFLYNTDASQNAATYFVGSLIIKWQSRVARVVFRIVVVAESRARIEKRGRYAA